MGRPQPTILGNPRKPTDITRMNERNARLLAGNVSFGSTMSNTDGDMNMNAWKANGTTPGTANTPFTIVHSLGRVPNTIVGQDTNNGGTIYRGGTWTKTQVILKCTTSSAIYNIILA